MFVQKNPWPLFRLGSELKASSRLTVGINLQRLDRKASLTDENNPTHSLNRQSSTEYETSGKNLQDYKYGGSYRVTQCIYSHFQ